MSDYEIKKASILKIKQNGKVVDRLIHTEDFINFLKANDIKYSEKEIKKMNRQQLEFAVKQTINEYLAGDFQGALSYEERRAKGKVETSE